MYISFFVPGYKLHKIESILKFGVDEIIIDIEDAIKASDREAILKRLLSENRYSNYYIRFPLYDYKGTINTTTLSSLLEKGFKKLVFPKIASADDFQKVSTVFSSFDIRIILLIETPRFLLEVKDILLKYQDYFSGIAVGSHDFMNIVGGENTLRNLEFLRLQVLYLARMINVFAIDIASMELENEKNIQDEIKDGIYKGFDSKFFIHPRQIEIYRKMQIYSDADRAWAEKVHKAFNYVQHEKREFNPIIVDGQIVEKPHIKRAEKILNYYRRYENI